LKATHFEAVGEGRYRVTGNLEFVTVPDLWEQSLADLDDCAEAVIDLSEVTEVDSAGLALAIEWVHWAHSRGRRLTLAHIPEKLLALARISETDHFLTSGTS